MASGLAELSALLAGVKLTDDPVSAGDLTGRRPPPTGPRPVSVTDLLEPRRAFWRRARGPAPMTPERELRIELGRAWHRRFGDALAAEGTLEVRVRRGGVSARIDVLADVPIELKTGAAPAEGAAPVDRPEQVEQLAVYCTLSRRRVGRLAHLALPESGPPTVAVTEFRFGDLASVDAEMSRREAALRDAFASGSPARLERCRWFAIGCEYRSGGICDCRGDEPRPSGTIGGEPELREPRPELSARWTARLQDVPAPAVRAPERFRDLLYPRRTYFRRTVGGAAEPFPVRPPGSPLDPYERTLAALEQGPVGELHRLATGAPEPDEEVLAWRGVPVLVRTSRARTRLAREDLRTRFPQYLLELGFRCAATRTTRGVVIVAYEASPPGAPPLEVFDVDFAPVADGFGRLSRARRAGLEQALEKGTPGDLPACPSWMAADCPYRDACGCAGPTPGRSQR